MTLEELKESGVVPENFQEISISKDARVVTYPDVKTVNAIVPSGSICVLDNYEGAATEDGISFDNARIVRTWKDSVVGTWDSKSKTFFAARLGQSGLETQDVVKLKEEKSMNLEDLKNQKPTAPMNAFTPGATSVPTGDMSDTKLRKEERKRVATEIRSRVDGTAGTRNVQAIITNQKYGRFAGFITKNDPTVKVSITKKPRLDADQKRMLLPDAPAEIVQLFAEKPGSVPLKYLVRDANISFRNAGPGKDIAMIIKTPAGTCVDLFNTFKEVEIDTGNTTLETKVLDHETGITFLAANYDGKIWEDENLLGNRACKLEVKVNAAISKNGESGISQKIVVSKEDGAPTRKTLITEGNYFPATVYKTINTQGMSADDIKILNLNIEASIQKDGAYDGLTEASKSKIKVDGKEVVSTAWFNEGEQLQIPSYMKDGQYLSSINIPTRSKAPGKKDPTKSTYSFEYYTVDDIENGPFSNPIYAKVAENSGLSREEFTEKVTKYNKNKSRGKKKDETSLSMEEFLRLRVQKKDPIAGTTSIEDMARMIMGVN